MLRYEKTLGIQSLWERSVKIIVFNTYVKSNISVQIKDITYV